LRISPVVGLLAFAAIVVLAAGVLVVFTVPSPAGWPPWGDEKVGERVQIVSLIVGVLGLAGVVLTLGAGVLELRQIFPAQSLTVRVIRVRDAEGTVLAGQWRLHVRNGGSLVSDARVEVEAWQMIRGERYRIRAIDGAAWSSDATGPQRLVWRDGFYPGQRVLGPIFQLPEAGESMIWSARWWTERSGPESLSTTVRHDDPYD
jgi:hypothetical protein